jgi:hypothetical protein
VELELAEEQAKDDGDDVDEELKKRLEILRPLVAARYMKRPSLEHTVTFVVDHVHLIVRVRPPTHTCCLCAVWIAAGTRIVGPPGA